MHICFICNEYPPDPHGGIGSVTRTLASAMVRRGHRVSVVGYTVSGTPGVTVDDGVKVIRLKHAAVPGTGMLVNGARLSRALLDLHATDPLDAIDGPEASFASLPHQLRHLSIIRMHGGHHFFSVTLGRRPAWRRSWLERRSFARAAHLCAVSEFVASTTLALLDQQARKVQVLPNPVDTTLFRPSPGVEEENTIVFAGTICEKKGVRQLLLAMPAIVAAVPSARLALVGRDSIDPETGGSYAAALQAALPAVMRPHVTFEGPLPHDCMPARLARATVCVYPSHMEALPLAWLEGMAMGKCVVASVTGPGREVIIHGESGLLCNPFNPAQLAAKVVSALTSAPLRARLGAAARARAVARFGDAALAERNEEFYRDCIRARQA